MKDMDIVFPGVCPKILYCCSVVRGMSKNFVAAVVWSQHLVKVKCFSGTVPKMAYFVSADNLFFALFFSKLSFVI